MAIIIKKRKRPPKLAPLAWIPKFTIERYGEKYACPKWIADGGNYTITQRIRDVRTETYQLVMGKDNETVYFAAVGSRAVETLMLVAEQYHQGEFGLPDF